MPFYRQLGSIPRKRHIEHRVSPGYRDEGIFYEEVITVAGFDRAYTIAYHLRPPTRVAKVEAAGTVMLEQAEVPVLRHHHLKSGKMPAMGNIVTGRVPLLFNADIIRSRCRPGEAQAELYRNAADDEVIFVHKGKGVLYTLFGPLPFKPFDYVVIPRCTTYRIEFDAEVQPDLLIVEAAQTIGIPPRYLN